MKIFKKNTKKIKAERYQGLKIGILVIVSIILFLPMISAFDFSIDNFKTFDKNIGTYGKIEVWDKGQIGSDTKLVDYILEDNSNQCLINCHSEGTATLYYDGRLFNDLEFIGEDNKNYNIKNSKIYIQKSNSYDEDILETTCSKIIIVSNGTSQECLTKKIGTKTITDYYWEEYNGQILKEGNYRWRIEASKSLGTQIDWVATSGFGEKLDSWLWWNNNWGSKKQINITGAVNTDLLNYSIYLEINKEYGMQSDYDDLRFVNESQDTELAFETDWENSSGIGVWVKVLNLTGASVRNTTIYMYYNNSLATIGEDWDSTWGNNAVAIYHMTTNVTGNDSSIAHNNLTIDGGVWLNTTPVKGFGNQLQFPGIQLSGSKGTSVKSSFGISGNSDFTLITKFSFNSTGHNGYIFELGNPTVNENGVYLEEIAGPNYRCAGFTGENNFGTPDTKSHWAMVRYSSGTLTCWIDGVKGLEVTPTLALVNDSILIGSNQNLNSYADLVVDEFRLYNASMSSAWLNRTLFLNDSGYYVFGDELNLTGEGIETTTKLNRPENNLNTINSSILFEANLSASGGNLTNTTLYVWNPDFSLFGINTTSITGTSNQSNLTLSNIVPANNYMWNFLTCGINSTASNCSWANANRTLNVKVYTENAETYSVSASEGSLETFQLNITTASLQVSTANLFYNNTNYSGTIVNTGDFNYTLTRILSTPDVIANSNITFYWDITLNGGYRDNSTRHNQTVFTFTLDNCSSASMPLYNFTMKDEKQQFRLNPTVYNTTIRVDLQLYTLNRQTLVYNYSTLYNATSEALICLSSNLTTESYSFDSQIQYDADLYASEFYNIQNKTINVSSFGTNITFYDLTDALSEQFVIYYKDKNFLPVSDALIQIQRKYIEEGIFKTIEIPKTDSEGKTLGHLEKTDAIYTFIVVRYGKVLGTFSNMLATCQNIVLGDCNINLNTYGSNIQPEDYTNMDDFTYSLDYNETSRLIQVIFTVPSSNPAIVLLNATQTDALGTTQICSDTLTSSSGTLSCTAPSTFGNGTATIKLYKNNVVVANGFVLLNKTSKDIYGVAQIMLLLILYLTLFGIGLSDEPMLMGVFLLVGVLLAVGMNVISNPSFGIGAIASTSLWLIIAIVIILVKGSKRA